MSFVVSLSVVLSERGSSSRLEVFLVDSEFLNQTLSATMFRHSLPRRLPYPHHPPPPASMPLPAIPPSMLPQNVAPTSFQKGVQATGFVLATGQELDCTRQD